MFTNVDFAWTFDCVRDTTCQHLPQIGEPPESGIWYVHHMEKTNHFSVAPFWFGSQTQREFWKETGQWLRQIDVLRSEKHHEK